MSRWSRFAALAALVLSPAVAAAQASPEARIALAMERARAAGVPVQLLESKLAEGRAKGVPLPRIAEGVEQRLEALTRVRGSMGERGQLTPAELGLAADAVQAGVSETVLATLAETAPRDRRAVAIAALTQLVQMGHASDEALARVTQALQRGPEALLSLPAQAAAGRAQGGGNARGQGQGAQDAGRGGPPASVPAGGQGQGRGRGGPPGGG